MLKFEREDGRYYYISCSHDKRILYICRGGKRVKVESQRIYDSTESLDKDVKRLSKRRLNHGYFRVFPEANN